MKKYIFGSCVVIIALLCITAFSKKENKTIDKGFAVIELFTSEGCSSCPAADEAVAEIAKQYKENVFILGFHVDYWDNLGWKDAFSKAAFSNRQRNYAASLSLNGVYTPQVVVNGETEFVGSDKTKLQNAIIAALKNPTEKKLEITAKESAGKIAVSIGSKVSAKDEVNIALVQLHAQDNVGAGENKGRMLHHINIVRELKTIDGNQKNQTVIFDLPTGLTKKDLQIVTFVQEKKSLHIADAQAATIE